MGSASPAPRDPGRARPLLLQEPRNPARTPSKPPWNQHESGAGTWSSTSVHPLQSRGVTESVTEPAKPTQAHQVPGSSPSAPRSPLSCEQSHRQGLACPQLDVQSGSSVPRRGLLTIRSPSGSP